MPLSKTNLGGKTVALIGPFVKAIRENLGFWSYNYPDDSARIISVWQGFANKVGDHVRMTYARGCGISDTSRSGFEEAVAAALQSDIVIMNVGEAPNMTGEAKSRSNIGLPGVQEDLIKAIFATGKPVVVLINAGRPLVFNWTADHISAIVYTWWLGTEAGDAIADVLWGDYNPSGKLPMSFPRTEGQIPVYYNYYSTGRPAKSDTDLNYVSSYTDLPNSPKFPFGYGLSYTTFSYSDMSLSAKSMSAAKPLRATVSVTNTGKFDGKETVQLYTRQMVGSIVRPVKELKGFRQVFLKAGETKAVTFTLTADDLRFYNRDLKYGYEPGDFEIFIGTNSRDVQHANFTLVK